MKRRCCEHRRIDHAEHGPRACSMPGCKCAGWVDRIKGGGGTKGVKRASVKERGT